jgi:hypothetical protein
MTEEQVIAKLLNLKALKLPPEAKVVDIRWNLYVDHAGEDALEVWVILDELTTPETHGWKVLRPVERAIRDSLLAAGIKRFPYTHYSRQSEVDRAEIKV